MPKKSSKPQVLPPSAPAKQTRSLEHVHAGFRRYMDNKKKLREENPLASLSFREMLFVHELLVEANKMNYAAAARRAGYEGSHAGMTLMAKPHIRRYVDQVQQERLKKLSVTADRVLNEIAKVAFSNMGNYIVIGEDGCARVDLTAVAEDQDKSAAMQEITVEEVKQKTGEFDADGKPTWETVRRVKFKLGEKMKALELLGKNLSLFSDNIRLSSDPDNPLPAPVFKIEFV